VTPIFLHAGLIHLATNLLMQARLGLFIEAQWGTRVFTVMYLVTGTFASLCSAVFKPEQIAVGASGSLMGVMG
jgi:membrane associated rhomboid family serine protease